MDVYQMLVNATANEIIRNPSLKQKQIKGYVEYLGVFVPRMRDKIISDAKELAAKE